MNEQQLAAAQPAQDNTYGYAKSLAESLFKKHYAHEEPYASGSVVWEVSDTTIGVLTQIDNMVCTLVHQPAPVQEPVATLFGSLPVYDTTPPAAQPDYAWPTIADYEKEVGFEVNDAFKAAWTMARTTNDLFKQMGANT